MIRSLRWIAGIGLTVGIISLAIAVTIGGYGVRDLWDRANFNRLACGNDKGASGTTSSGTTSERRLAWGGGDSIEIAVPASITLRMGQGSDIVVRGPAGAISHVDVHGKRLTLDCHWPSARDIEIVLPGKAFRHIGLSGSTRLVMEGLDQPELDLRISGSGTVQAKGIVDRVSLKVSGSGDGRLAGLAMKSLTLKISGSGDVEAGPTEEADVSISGSGTLRLLTRPARLKTHIAGSGRILQPPVAATEKK